MRLFLALLLSNLTLGNHGLLEEPYGVDSFRACGPMCLCFLDHYYGHVRPYSEIMAICPPGPAGTTLQQLAQGASRLSLSGVPFRCTAARLRDLVHPAILHLDRGSNGSHFVVAIGWSQERAKFSVFDPPNTLKEVSETWLTSQYSGNGLAIVAPGTDESVDDLFRQPRVSGLALLACGIGWMLLLWVAVVGVRGRRKPA